MARAHIEDKVFTQAARLALPQIHDIWDKHKREWGAALTPDSFNSMLPFTLGKISEDALREVTTVSVQACIDAHVIGKYRRNRKWSVDSFTEWCANYQMGGARLAKDRWASDPGTPWAEMRGDYLPIIDLALAREKTRAEGLIRQHFAKSTKSGVDAFFATVGAFVKAVPGGIWTWLFGGGALVALATLARHVGVSWPF